MRHSIHTSYLAVCLMACSGAPTSGTGNAAQGSNDDAGNVGLPAEGVTQGEAGPAPDSTPAPQANLRVAHLSADLPAFDVCVAPHGTTSWQGPLIAQLSGLDAGAPGLAYARVSAYVPVTPGQNDVAIVAAGSTSCDRNAEAGATLPVVTNLPPLAANDFGTLIAAGEASPIGSDHALAFGLVRDDSQLAGGAASLRAVNALPRAGALDFGLGSSATKWTPLFTNAAFGTVDMQTGPSIGAVDANGYLPIPSLVGQTMSIRESSNPNGDMAMAHALPIPVGSIATLFAVGGSAEDSAHPAALLLCIDNQPSGGLLSDCSLAR